MGGKQGDQSSLSDGENASEAFHFLYHYIDSASSLQSNNSSSLVTYSLVLDVSGQGYQPSSTSCLWHSIKYNNETMANITAFNLPFQPRVPGVCFDVTQQAISPGPKQPDHVPFGYFECTPC